MSSQSDRSRGDASASLGNHTTGTETTRPSDNVTDSVSLEHETSTASVSAFSTKVLVPFLQEGLRVLHASGLSHVHVWRLAPLHAEEEEPIPTDPR